MEIKIGKCMSSWFEDQYVILDTSTYEYFNKNGLWNYPMIIKENTYKTEREAIGVLKKFYKVKKLKVLNEQIFFEILEKL